MAGACFCSVNSASAGLRGGARSSRSWGRRPRAIPATRRGRALTWAFPLLSSVVNVLREQPAAVAYTP